MATTANKVVVSRSTNTAPVFKDADGVEIETGTGIDQRGGREHAEGCSPWVPRLLPRTLRVMC